MKPILKLQDASKIYRQGGVKTVGIEAVNLEIYPHDFVAITGRSGCGKSTLLNILGCMDELTSGSYFFDGEDITRLKSRMMPLAIKVAPSAIRPGTAGARLRMAFATMLAVMMS